MVSAVSILIILSSWIRNSSKRPNFNVNSRLRSGETYQSGYIKPAGILQKQLIISQGNSWPTFPTWNVSRLH